MTQPEQKRLYSHYLNLSINGADSIQKANALGYAKQILDSYPEFEIKEASTTPAVKPVEVKAKPKEKKK